MVVSVTDQETHISISALQGCKSPEYDMLSYSKYRAEAYQGEQGLTVLCEAL